MSAPITPPDWRELIQSLDQKRVLASITAVETVSTKARYLHWDKLIHLKPPDGLSHEEWWLGLKLGRQKLYKSIPLLDKNGRPFKFLLTDQIPEALHHIDMTAGRKLGVPEAVVNTETRERYYVSSLIEEAITSSQLEGATTTREVAKEMIRSARQPRDRSERMILNNFHTMQRIGKIKNEELSKELVFELHRIVTQNALDNPSAVGRFRAPEEDIVVGDYEGEVFHVPPPAFDLDERMAKMCDFANAITPEYFVHPAIRAIILHFWLAYDHPFVDGNGRTARALFYWAMLHYGFWVCEFISISHIIRKAPAKYGKAFLYTETDDNDLTYFIAYHIDVLQRSLNALDSYVKEKSEKSAKLERQIRNVVFLNQRQRALLGHALNHPHALYTTEGHMVSHNVSYQTARNDLTGMVSYGLLKSFKRGKTYFAPADSLAQKLETMF